MKENTPKPASGRATAAIYLRVSTKEQAETGGTAEGFSIPAQRDACSRKAGSLEAEVIEEFVDRGESARSAKRPELQRLLTFVKANSVDFVIVHKVDRLARNRADDVSINLALQSAGVQLVSATENIDETPSGLLLHGIMSSIAEFYSQNLASEVIKGSTEKARAGGTVGKAPTGYRNVRKIVNGREMRTVEVDDERGPLMRWAIEQYATGEWTTRALLAAVTERGLTSLGGPRTPSRPLSLSNFCRLLRTPYYTGVVTYRGVTYPGTHEPLVSRDTFDRVQAILDAHDRSGEKQRVHHHFLKGSVFCGTCGSRLSIMNAKNRYGRVYPYFYCLGRQQKRTNCNQRAVLIDAVEDKVSEYYSNVQLSAEQQATVRLFILELFADRVTEMEAEEKRQRGRIEELTGQRQKLLQAHYAGAIPLDQLKDEQERISRESADAQRLLEASQIQEGKLRENLDAALNLLTDCKAAYLAADPMTKRRMNQALFTRIAVLDGEYVIAELAEPFGLLTAPEVLTAAKPETQERDLWSSCNRPARITEPGRPEAVSAGAGSRKDWMVGEGGLEPPHPFGHRNLNPGDPMTEDDVE